MKQLFIVTSGEYSDYSIIACFSTEKKAKDFMKYFSGLSKWNSPRVEVYGLDLSVIEQAEKGYTVYAIEQVENSTMLGDLQLDSQKKYAIVMGNEVKGVQQVVVDACDGCIEIPQYGTKHSLNVSVTTGIVIWDFFKQLHP